MAEKRNVMTLDPELYFQRHLQYREKHSSWHIFTGIFWGVYLFILGVMLISLVPATLNYTGFFGWALVLLAFFVIVYGFASSLHLKLMKRYG